MAGILRILCTTTPLTEDGDARLWCLAAHTRSIIRQALPLRQEEHGAVASHITPAEVLRRDVEPGGILSACVFGKFGTLELIRLPHWRACVYLVVYPCACCVCCVCVLGKYPSGT